MDHRNCARDVPLAPSIFKLNVDCFEKLFDYLGKEDVHAFGQTCKRMLRVAGHYYRQDMPGDIISCHANYLAGFREYAKAVCAMADFFNMSKIDWELFQSITSIHLD